MQINGFLRAGAGTDGYLRGEKYPQTIIGWLRGNLGAQTDGYLRYEGPAAAAAAPAFPTQFAGLRYFLGTVRDLCLVALADAATGDQVRLRKGGVDYAAYLVDVADPLASQVRVQTSEGLRAVRLKT